MTSVKVLSPLFISKPYGGRLLSTAPPAVQDALQWHLIAARAVTDDDGAFAGVSLAVVNPGYFQEQVDALDIGQV